MIKYFCDKCGNEFKEFGLAIPIYVYDALGVKICSFNSKHICDECAKKFNMIKDRLEHEEDFFDMSDEDISLMEYDFRVGDTVVTSTGETGVIESICDCERCRARGFYEPQVKLTEGVYDIYIIDNDKNNGFKNFFKIGKYKFGNVDKESIEHDIELETRNIKEAFERLEIYREQLTRISALDFLNEINGQEVYNAEVQSLGLS